MKDKTVIVTGAARGLGQKYALELSKAGALVVAADINSCEETKKLIQENGNDCLAFELDVTDFNNCKNLISKTLEKFSKIDVLINNAGIYLKKPFMETSMEEFRNVIETNFLSIVSVTKTLFPLFKTKKSGMIININSLAGKDGSESELAYCASKHALRGFSRSLQSDATRHGIRVLEVYLGAMETSMTKTRENKDKLIKSDEVSDIIYNVCKNYDSVRITELNLMRAIY
jgi:NAD(P)-dependent dehydrogenase (short-subunit alcohol dehydrogenase family)